jgi:hypothetical protein
MIILVFFLQVGAPARVGLVAPVDVVVPPGNTGLDPSQTSFFQVSLEAIPLWLNASTQLPNFSLVICFRCLTSPPRLTRVLSKLSPLWS